MSLVTFQELNDSVGKVTIFIIAESFITQSCSRMFISSSRLLGVEVKGMIFEAFVYSVSKLLSSTVWVPDPDVGARDTEETKKDPFLVWLLYCLSCPSTHTSVCLALIFIQVSVPVLPPPRSLPDHSNRRESPFLMLFTLPDFSSQPSPPEFKVH